MKTTIYELLGMIKDGKFVKRVLFKNKIYEYEEDGEDYFNEEDGWLLDGYSTLSILNEPVEILDNIENNKQDKIEKVDTYVLCDSDFHRRCDDGTSLSATEIIDVAFQEYSYKINEIIDRLNNE